MFYEIFGDVFYWVRKSGGLTQAALAAEVGRERHTVRRWERGEAMPSPEQEKKLFELAQCPRLLFAEFVCKRLTRYILRPVVILPQGEIKGLPTTPLAEAQELLAEHYGKIPPELRDRLLARIGRLQVMQHTVEQEVREMVGEVRAYLRAAKVMKEERKPL